MMVPTAESAQDHGLGLEGGFILLAVEIVCVEATLEIPSVLLGWSLEQMLTCKHTPSPDGCQCLFLLLRLPAFLLCYSMSLEVPMSVCHPPFQPNLTTLTSNLV